MPPNVIYLLLDKPWRARTILRAYRVYRLHKRYAEQRLVHEWAVDRIARRLEELVSAPLPEWQARMIHDLAAQPEGTKVIVAVPRQW